MLDAAPKRSVQGWVDRRDPRFKALVRATVRGSGRPVDGCVRDISSRGMLLQSDTPPPYGTIIEIVGAFPPVVGQVAWVSGRRFGIATQGRITLSDFLSAKSATPAEDTECRPPSSKARHEERYRFIGRWVQFGTLVLGGGAVAFTLAQRVYQLFADVAFAVEMRL